MWETRSCVGDRVESVGPDAQCSPRLFSPLLRQNGPVFPVIHTPTTSTSFFLQ